MHDATWDLVGVGVGLALWVGGGATVRRGVVVAATVEAVGDVAVDTVRWRCGADAATLGAAEDAVAVGGAEPTGVSLCWTRTPSLPLLHPAAASISAQAATTPFVRMSRITDAVAGWFTGQMRPAGS